MLNQQPAPPAKINQTKLENSIHIQSFFTHYKQNQMIHLTSPLGLRTRIKPPSISIEAIPFINVLCIAFFISLLSSKYLFAPGLTIELPESSESRIKGTITSAILSVNEANMIFFEGNIYNLENIEQALAEFVKTSPVNSPILLAKINKGTDVDVFFKICEMAHKAGFSNIQLAANAKQDKSDLRELREVQK